PEQAGLHPLPVAGVPGRALRCAEVVGNLPTLAQAAAGQGGVNVAADDDGVTRRYPYLFAVDGRVHASLALATAMLADPSQAEALLRRATEADRGAPWLRPAPKSRFRTVRFSDVLEAPPDSPALEAALRDRIVFVGVSAYGTEDFAATILERDVPGVFVHAQALVDLRGDHFLRGEGDVPRAAFWAGLALLFLSAVIGWRLRTAPALIGFCLAVVAIWVGVWLFAMHQGWLIPLMAFVWAVADWLAIRLLFAYFRSREARKRATEIRRAFQHYLSPEVVQILIDDPARLRLGGERRELTAFFSDIRGFTGISENLDPADLIQLLNECLGRMSEIILEEGGTIDKYIGDAIVAMFGAPVGDARHAVHACRAALRCQETLVDLRARWAERGLPQLYVRIGLNSGVALVGNMGSAQRFDYTMIGDTVNLASRLEAANRMFGSGILVGEKTIELARDAVLFRDVGRLQVRGRHQAVRVAEPLALTERATDAQRQLAAVVTDAPAA
ncbi:MAG: adenylate/guanylate cyclase domain-containing protein, partial [Myxococcales bacterium]|nr:adenylate/guanylate cyclase domain-containing protein [Myxococcales bacterium]